MFEVYTSLVCVIIVLGTGWGVLGARDTLHPLVYLMPMAGFIYVYMPLDLYGTDFLFWHFTKPEIEFVQRYNFLSVAALALGCYWSSRKPRRRTTPPVSIDTPYWRRRLWQFSLLLGGLGVLAYAYQIANVGGLVEAYDTVKGGGWATSGYIRDTTILVVPGIGFLYLSRASRDWNRWHWVFLAVMSSPLLLHGLLGARRGPTFMGLATLGGGWYLAHRTRPRFSTVLTAGAGVGILLLVLVAFRGQIYLGSDFWSGGGPPISEMVESAFESRTTTDFENEFLYGAYVVRNAHETGDHWWGRRYLTQVFVRPIPSAIWPGKYADVGMSAITENSGMLGREGRDAHPEIPRGAAPGFAASAYVEWAWGGVLFVFLVGWFFGYSWQQAVRWGGIWKINYLALLALSVYFVAQSGLAVLFRYLLIIIPSVMLWQWAKAQAPRQTHRQQHGRSKHYQYSRSQA